MNHPEFLTTVVALPTIIGESTSPSEAWATVRNQAINRWGLASDLPEFDIDVETDNVVVQLRKVFSESPAPPNLTLLYYGLYIVLDSETMDERAGFYVAGSTQTVPSVESSSDLAGTYWTTRQRGGICEVPCWTA